MENNLLIGDHLLVNKFVFGPTAGAHRARAAARAPIRRGDIIVFKYPEDRERDFIKRVIGLPGETLEVRDKRVYINGKPIDEPYVHFLEPPPGVSRLLTRSPPTTCASATARSRSPPTSTS